MRASEVELAGRVERLRRSARVERAKALAPRYALIGACALLGLAGLKEIAIGDPTVSGGRGRGAAGDPAMVQFAVSFARTYLTYDASDPERREAALRRYLPEYLTPDGGFDPQTGRQAVLWAEVAQNQEAIAGGRIITVAAQTDRLPTPTYLAVPMRRLRSGELVLAGYPALVGAPAVARSVSEPLHESVEDPELQAMTERVVSNYLAGQLQNLRADLARGNVVTFPVERLELSSLDQLVWADRAEGGEAVLATVSAGEAGVGSYSLTYEIGVTRQGGRWYARWIEVIPTGR
jgi:Conjugative transposon protein TcpC